jgi:hypothetical protein
MAYPPLPGRVNVPTLAQLLRPASTGIPPTLADPPDYGYGKRWDEATQGYNGPPKGLGYLGPLQLPNGQGIASEFSRDGEIDGKPVQYPLIVPTLTKSEVLAVLRAAAQPGAPVPQTVEDKAMAFAKQRLADGKDPFASPDEQQNLYPELARGPIPGVKPR